MVKAMEDEKLVQLKTIYDELWSDARTMIKDMNNNITMIFLFGLLLLAASLMSFGTAVDMYSRINAGSTRWLDYFYLVTTSLGMVITVIAGVGMMRWHFTLKERYAKLILLEKTLED